MYDLLPSSFSANTLEMKNTIGQEAGGNRTNAREHQKASQAKWKLGLCVEVLETLLVQSRMVIRSTDKTCIKLPGEGS